MSRERKDGQLYHLPLILPPCLYGYSFSVLFNQHWLRLLSLFWSSHSSTQCRASGRHLSQYSLFQSRRDRCADQVIEAESLLI
jgi:hypothetical protein